jgi:hypothetical protein
MRASALALTLLLSASACASGAATSTHQASAPVTDVALAPPPAPSTAEDAPREDRKEANAALLSALAAESGAFGDVLGSSTIDSADLSGTGVGVLSQGAGVGGLGGMGTRGSGPGSGGGLSGLGSGSGFSGSTTPTGPRTELAISTPTVRGGLDPDATLRVFKVNSARLRFCYQRQLTTAPQLAGTLDVTLTLGAEGEVTNVTSSGGTLQSADVESCVLTQLRRVAFHKPTGGAGTVAVTLRFSQRAP